MTTTATPSAAVTTRTRWPASLRRVRPIHVVAAETVLAGILTSYGLGRQSLWFDETVTADAVHRDFPSTIHWILFDEPTNSLYLLALRIWNAPLGESEASLRSLSLILGVALVPVVYVMTRRLFGVRPALIAGLLTAVSATVVAEAQQARQYALVLLTVALATLCFVRAVEVGTQWSWLLYALVAALAVYASFLALFVLAGHALSLVALPKSEVRWRAALVAAGAFALAVLPLLAGILRHGSGGISWIEPTSWSTVQRTFEMFAGGTGLLLVAGLVACGFALLSASRTWRSSGRGIQTWRYTVVITWLVTPVIGLLLASLVKPLFVSRYMIGVLPAFVILVAVGITAIRPPLMGAALLAVFVVLSASVVVNWLGSDTRTAWTGVPREDWRGAVTYVLTHASASDAVVLQPGYLESAWTYYYRRHGSPRDAPALASTALVEDLTDRRAIRSIADRYSRVWMVTRHLDAAARRDVRARFAANYALTGTRRFTGGVDVFRFDA